MHRPEDGVVVHVATRTATHFRQVESRARRMKVGAKQLRRFTLSTPAINRDRPDSQVPQEAGRESMAGYMRAKLVFGPMARSVACP
jgi:hypothetical protein